MAKMTPEQEGNYAFNWDLPREDLKSDEAKAAYDRRKAADPGSEDSPAAWELESGIVLKDVKRQPGRGSPCSSPASPWECCARTLEAPA